MGLDDPSVAQSGLVSVCMGALTGALAFGWARISKTTVTLAQLHILKVEYEVDK